MCVLCVLWVYQCVIWMCYFVREKSVLGMLYNVLYTLNLALFINFIHG